MEALFAYASSSRVASDADGARVLLAPNLARPPVALDARLLDPLLFRDAFLALADVVRSEQFVPAEEVVARQLDPVVTVTRGPVFLEGFSRDESSYGRVALREGLLADEGERTPGCTSIETSPALVAALAQIRSGRPTRLGVRREAVSLRVGPSTVREARIDLPDGWVRGFLEVQSALGLPAHAVTLAPADLRDVLVYLGRRRETASPRALVFRLAPGEPPSVLVQPWNELFTLRRSSHAASRPAEVKVWGRRRLLLLRRVLPHARRIELRLPGSGLPSFWRCDLGDASFLLGLTPWASRDWTADEPRPPRELPAEGVLRPGRALVDVETGLLHERDLFPWEAGNPADCAPAEPPGYHPPRPS